MKNKFIEKFIKDSDFKIVLRSQNKNEWNLSLSQLEYVPIKYTNLWFFP